MSRPPLRMCARCQRTTDAPVLVHEVHAATGPGFNVYACPDCATHYPPPTDILELLPPAPTPAPRESRLTLRTYKVDAEGAVTEDSGVAAVVRGGRSHVPPAMSAFAPCGCRRCRSQ